MIIITLLIFSKTVKHANLINLNMIQNSFIKKIFSTFAR